MVRRHFHLLSAVVCVVVGLLMATNQPANAIGYYNVPGSFCQCFGYGNGAGHHACLVLGPSTCAGFCATHEVRVECPPQPPYSDYNYGQCKQGYSGEASQGSWIPEPAPMQVAPQVAPTPAAARPQVHRQPRVW
jgi:hypothetical protein